MRIFFYLSRLCRVPELPSRAHEILCHAHELLKSRVHDLSIACALPSHK